MLRAERRPGHRGVHVGCEAPLPPAGDGNLPGCHRSAQNGSMNGPRLDLIATDPAIAHGQPTIAGTRIMVSVVLDCLAAGMTIEKILAEYPSLTEDGIRAAAAYGAALAREELLPLRPSA